jgi:sec-independent protein translocase protein TatB
MFNFGISELMIIAVVGLIVIGPERLPRVARTLGHLFGRMQRYVTEIKADINREVELDELRKFQSSMKEAAQEIEESVSKQVNFIEDEVKQAESETRKSVEEAVKPAAGINLVHSLDPPDHPHEETAGGAESDAAGSGEAAREDDTKEPPASGEKPSPPKDKQA